MITKRQKLFLGGAVLLSVLLAVGSYFGSRWLFPVSNLHQDTLSQELKALADEKLAVLKQYIRKEYPAVPEGYPENLKPVWLEDYFDENLHAPHVIMQRVAIELWNQGERGFVNITMDYHSGKVYLLYPGVVYVTWSNYSREDPDGQSIQVPYISHWLGTPSTVDPLLNSNGQIFTEQEIMSGVYMTMYPGVEFVNYNDAGYDPATILRRLLTKGETP